MATLTARYTQLFAPYRQLLGFALEPGGAPTYQVVLLPTFHHPCGISFRDDAREPLLSLQVLPSTLPDAAHGRWEDIAVCTPAQFEQLHKLVTRLAPGGVDEDEACGRDGIVVSIMWHDTTGARSAFLTSATLSTQHSHWALMDGLIDTARALFGQQPMPAVPGRTVNAYLSHVQRYWPARPR